MISGKNEKKGIDDLRLECCLKDRQSCYVMGRRIRTRMMMSMMMMTRSAMGACDAPLMLLT